MRANAARRQPALRASLQEGWGMKERPACIPTTGGGRGRRFFGERLAWSFPAEVQRTRRTLRRAAGR